MSNMPQRRLALYMLGAFVAGIACTALAPLLVARIADRIFPLGIAEIARVTSPDGVVDAVMIRDNCGAPCSYGYSVFVVSRGKAAPKDLTQNVFSGDDMTGGKITWRKAHVLDVLYDRARIYGFRNISYPLGASQKNWNYKVEIRLRPSSELACLGETDLH